MTLAERIREAFGEARPADIARAMKKTKGAVSQWLDGTTQALKGDTAAKMEALTGYRASWLVTGKGPKKISDGPAPPPLSESELALLGDFRALDDDDKAELAEEIHTRATKTRSHVLKVLRGMGVQSESAIAAAVSAYERATVEVWQSQSDTIVKNRPSLPPGGRGTKDGHGQEGHEPRRVSGKGNGRGP